MAEENTEYEVYVEYPLASRGVSMTVSFRGGTRDLMEPSLREMVRGLDLKDGTLAGFIRHETVVNSETLYSSESESGDSEEPDPVPGESETEEPPPFPDDPPVSNG